jgi:hypothetical protein
MLYEMLDEPPAPGTPLESLMLMVWRARQDIELQKTRSIVGAIVASSAEGENIEKANKQMTDTWADLLDEMYPYQRNKREKEEQSAIKYLLQEVARGPLKVTPLQPVGQIRSKLRTKYMEREPQR